MSAVEYVDRWECLPPPPGKTFRVIRAEWVVEDDGLFVRVIHEIEVIDFPAPPDGGS